MFNFAVLKSLATVGSFLEEAIQLGEDLGIAPAESEPPELDELFDRLHSVRPEWDWPLRCGVDYLARFAEYATAYRPETEPQPPAEPDLGPVYPPVSRPELVSPWKIVFYRALYAAGLRPIPQYSVEQYILDFALLAGARRLNIEVDGEHHHRNWDGELCRRD